MRGWTTLFLIACLGLPGCTTSLVSREQRTLPAGVRPGVAYRLPVLQYRLTARFTLAGCAADDKGLLPLRIETTAEATTIEGEARVIDYERLGSATKTTSLAIDFHEGTQLLKSINAQVTDHGPEIAANVVKTAAMVGRLATGLPGPAGGGNQAQVAPRVRCKAGVAELVAAAGAARKAIADFPETSQAVADRLAVHTARAQLGVLTAAEKRRAAADVQLSKDLAKQLAGLTKTAADLDKRLTFTAEWRFPEEAEGSKVLQAPDELMKWLTALLDGAPADLGAQANRTLLSASLLALTAPPACDPADDADRCRGVSLDDGVVYRVAAPGRLKVCAGADAAICDRDPQPLLATTALVPQFGPRQVLRLHNGWGEDNELSATFSAAGTLTSFRYLTKSASAQKASAVVLDAATQAVAFADARRAQEASEKAADAAEAAAKSKAETDAIQHQIEVLTKTGELAALQSRQADAARAAVDAQTSALAAQVALLKLEKERKELLEALEPAK